MTKATEFRLLFCRKMAELGYVEIWSRNGEGMLLQGHHYESGYPNGCWAVELTVRGNKAVGMVGRVGDHILGGPKSGTELRVDPTEDGALEMANWVIEQSKKNVD